MTKKLKKESSAQKRMGELCLADGGGLAGGPMSAGFYGALAEGLYRNIVQPIANDVQATHKVLKEDAPLPYAIAQLHPAVGIPAAALDYAQASEVASSANRSGDVHGLRKAQLAQAAAAMSAIPVLEKSYRLGNVIAKSAKDALLSNPAGVATAGSAIFGGMHKGGAAVNTMQMHDAAFNQFAPKEHKYR